MIEMKFSEEHSNYPINPINPINPIQNVDSKVDI